MFANAKPTWHNVCYQIPHMNTTIVSTLGRVKAQTQSVISRSRSIAVSLLLVLAGENSVRCQSILPPVITHQPASLQVNAGQTAVLNVGVSGTGPLTYQWLFNGNYLPNQIISTVAGGASLGYSGDGGPATNATLHDAAGVAVDAVGNLYIADEENSRIRKVDTNGIITTVAGNGANGYSGDGVAATNASLRYPRGVAVDAAGNLFIADNANQRIRKVDTNGIITTLAGNGTNGYAGDGGAATSAKLQYPYGVAVDAAGNVYIADGLNSRIRKVATNGLISTVVGNGTNGFAGDGGAATNAEMYWTYGVTVDAAGNLFIADSQNNRIRKAATNGIITTVAGDKNFQYGGDGVPATSTSLWMPYGTAVDPYGNLYIADTENGRVRLVNTSNIITTVAGGNGEGYGGDGGAATNASLVAPSGLALDSAGNLYIADQGGDIRKVTPAGPVLTVGNTGLANAGNYQVIITGPGGSVTSSVVALTVEISPAIAAVAGGNGSVTLNLLTQPNESSEVWAATNLVAPIVWQSVATNIPGTDGLWQFTDANASQYPVRFYRASTP